MNRKLSLIRTTVRSLGTNVSSSGSRSLMPYQSDYRPTHISRKFHQKHAAASLGHRNPFSSRTDTARTDTARTDTTRTDTAEKKEFNSNQHNQDQQQNSEDTSSNWVAIPISVGIVYIGLMQLYKVFYHLNL